MFLSKKNSANLYTKHFAFFTLNNSPDVAWHDLKDINLKVSGEMIPVYPCLNVMFFKVLFMQKTFFARVCFFNDIPYLAKLCQRKVMTQNGKNFTRFCFVLFWNFVFMCKGSQPKIYADLLRFQSRVKDPIHIIILMQSIILFLILSFHVFALVHKQDKPKNNMKYI